MPAGHALHPALRPWTRGGLQLRNRIVKVATYEGMVVDGLPSQSLLRHHRELAAGGVGMTTVAYCAVSPDGRTFANQMVMDARTVAPLRAVTQAVHAEGAAAMLQLGHCGGFTKNEQIGAGGPRGPSAGFNAYGLFKGMPRIRAMTEDDMAAVEKAFVAASHRALEAGFDAIEAHLGHGYLLSQFLSPRLNRRRDAYGGSLEHRLRFPLRVVRAVREALGDRAALFVKMNLDDGVADGLHVDEAVEVARALEREHVDALVLSGGLVSHSAMYLLRGGRPLTQMIEVEPSRLQKQALRLFGPVFVQQVPFEPLFFLEQAQQVRAAVRLPLVYLGGVTDLDGLAQVQAAGFELVGVGRALIRSPDLIARFAEGSTTRSECDACNECITEMDRPGGVVCAKVAAQLRRREAEVRDRLHLSIAGG